MGATLIVGDKTYDISVEQIEFSQEANEYESFSGQHSVMYGRQMVEISGRINSIQIVNTIKEEAEKMSKADEYACVDANDYNGDVIARKLVALELTEEEILFRKHGIKNLDGTLTEKGKTFLLNLLFSENTDMVVESLNLIEEAEEQNR